MDRLCGWLGTTRVGRSFRDPPSGKGRYVHDDIPTVQRTRRETTRPIRIGNMYKYVERLWAFIYESVCVIE